MKPGFVCCALVMLFLASCSTSGPKYKEIKGEQAKSVIYVYRDSNIFTSWLDATIYLDDQLIATLPDESYIVMLTNPGTYKLHYAMEEIGSQTPPIIVSTQAGSEYYIKLQSSGIVIPDYQNVSIGFHEEYAANLSTNRTWQKFQETYKKDKVEIENTRCAGSFEIGSGRSKTVRN